MRFAGCVDAVVVHALDPDGNPVIMVVAPVN
jgi:hypothetical protein